MRNAFLLSVMLHVGVVVLAWRGIPLSYDTPSEPVRIIAVEIATETVTTKRIAPNPKTAKQEPPPEPEAEPEKEVAALTPRKPAPKEVPSEPESIPMPSPETSSEPDQPALPVKPRPKPTPPKQDDFVSVMKDVAELEDEPEPVEQETTETDDLLSEVAALLEDDPSDEQTQQTPILGNRLTISEIDAVRRQIEPCWNVQIGARNPEELIVDVRVYMNRDGSVRKAQIIDTARMRSDAFFRAAAESALRAMLNNNCTPLKLPADKYDRWQQMVLRFDPSQMVGR
jgi:outer membrane biosynthesis protein TonB